MRLISCIAALGFPTLALFAQQPPYDVFPPAEPPYYRVRYEASDRPGELIYPVKFTLWAPPGVKTLRGVVVHQHGCGEGSCKSGLTGAHDLHWQALAQKHACALMAPSYEQPEKADCQKWCDPRNGSGQAFQRALDELGALCGHPELSTVPWALWGHSGGGHWAGGMTLLHPERVAAVWLRSGVPLFQANPERTGIQPYAFNPAAGGVPMMCNPGTREGVTEKTGRFAGVWPSNEAFFKEVRSHGGLIGVAVDPLTAHECGNQRYLAIAWLDACLSARLPDQPGQPLKSMSAQKAWLAPLLSPQAEPEASFTGARAEAVWLPNEAIAKAWMHYVRDTQIPDNTPPPAPFNIRTEGRELKWDAAADLESGIARFIIEKDGKEVASVPEKRVNPFGRLLFQGLQYSDTPAMPLVAMSFTLPEGADPKNYRVRTENTVGLISE